MIDHSKMPLVENILSMGKIESFIDINDFLFMTSLMNTCCYELQRRASVVAEQYNFDDYINFGDYHAKNYDIWNKSSEREQWLQDADNYIKFLLDYCTPEYTVMGVRYAIALYKLPFKLSRQKQLGIFGIRYNELILTGR